MTSAVPAGSGDVIEIVEKAGTSDEYIIEHKTLTEDADKTVDPNDILTVSGKLNVYDADDDGKGMDKQTISVTSEFTKQSASEDSADSAAAVVIAGQYGVLTIKSDGSYSYTLQTEPNKDDYPTEADYAAALDRYNALQELGETNVNNAENFTVTTTDKHGATDSVTLSFNVSGSNDDPKFPDPEEPKPEIDPNDPLASGANNVVIEAGDGRDNDTHEVTPGTPNADYAGKLSTSGTLSATDVDAVDDLTFTVKNADGDYVESVTSAYGKLEITNDSGAGDRDAEYTFTLDPSSDAAKAEIDGLSLGEEKEITFDILVDDGNGGTSTSTLTITVVGTNDQPIMTSAVAAGSGDVLSIDTSSEEHVISHVSVHEGAKDVTVNGKLNVYDADSDGKGMDKQTISATSEFTKQSASEDSADSAADVVIAGQYGTLTITADGSYSYTLQAEPSKAEYPNQDDYDAALARYEALNALEENDTPTESFTVTTTDKHGATDSVRLDFTVDGDSGPKITYGDDPNATTENVLVDEAFLATGSTEGKEAGDVAGEGTAASQAGKITFDFGSDGPATSGAFAWDLDSDSLPDVYNHDGQELSWRVNETTGDLEGYIPGVNGAEDEIYLSVEMELGTADAGKVDGNYTVTLHKPIAHDAPDSGETRDENQDLAGSGDAADTPTDLEFGFIITDSDGSTANGSLTVNVEDDVIDAYNVDEDGKESNVVNLDGDISAGSEFFTGSADANALKEAVSGKGETEHKNSDLTFTTDGQSTVNVGGFTITAATVTFTENGTTVGDELVLGWRDDHNESYGDGVGIIKDKDDDSFGHMEIGNTEGTDVGDTAEAFIIKLPEGETAYGIDLGFECLFTADTAIKENTETVRLEFYKDGKLVHTIDVTGTNSGSESLDTSQLSAEFDEVRVIPNNVGSDFVIDNVDFSQYSDAIVAQGGGQININSADGVSDIYFDKINGEAVADKSEITVDGKTLVLTVSGGVITATDADGTKYFTASVDPSTGEWLMYQHEYFDDSLNITFTAKDKDGDYVSYDVTVNGDAAPIATDDTPDSILEGGEVSGNILGNDTAGDTKEDHSGKEITQVTAPSDDWKELETEGNEIAKFESDAGIITFNKDGSYTFESKPNSTNENISFEFDYTITDADGDTDDATLTIDVKDVTIGNDATGGKVGADDDALNAAIKVDATLDSGISFDPAADLPQSDYGFFSYDDDNNLQFTQTTPYPHEEGSDSVDLNYTIITKDSSGNLGTATVTVTIGDSFPKATEDTAEVTEGGADATGDILANDSFGADGAPLDASNEYDDAFDMSAEVKVDGESTTWDKTVGADGTITLSHPDYGTLTVDKDGDFTFDYTDKSLTTGQEAKFEFGYTIKDSDGDPSTSSLTITAKGTDSEPDITFMDPTADANAHVTYDDETDTRDYNTDEDGNAQTVKGEFSVTLGDGTNTVTITGANGKELNITVVDGVVSYTDENGHSVDLNTFSLEGTYGNLSGFTYVDGTVNYIYDQDGSHDHNNPTVQGDDDFLSESFGVSITDGDGDFAKGSIDIKITDDAVELVREDELETVTTLKDQDFVTKYEEFGYVTRDGQSVEVSRSELQDGEYFTSVTGFKPTESADGVDVLVYPVTAEKGVGASVSGDMGFEGNVADGATLSVDFIAEGKSGTTPTLTIDGTPVTYKSFTNDDGTITIRAGSITAWNNQVEDISDPYFDVTYNPSTGEWSFEQYKSFEQEFILEFKATDGDGDIDIQYVKIQPTTEAIDIEVKSSDSLTVDEANLAAGTDANITGVDPDGVTEVASGELVVESFDGLSSVKIGDTVIAEFKDGAWTYDKDGTSVDGGTVRITSVTVVDGEYSVKYEYTLSDSIDGGNNTPEEAAKQTEHKTDGFTLTLTDTTGDTADVEIDVTVRDDAPPAHNDVDALTPEGSSEATALTNINFGADNGEGKTLEFGDSTFRYDEENGWEVGSFDSAGEWTASADQSSVVTEGDKVSLKTDDMTLENYGDDTGWIAKVDVSDLPEGDSKNVNVTVTDADGDATDFDVIAKNEDLPDGEIKAVDGTSILIDPGTDYNAVFILDTSASMWDNRWNGVINEDKTSDAFGTTRLDATIDSIIDLINDTLVPYTENALGGSVNIYINQFWGTDTENQTVVSVELTKDNAQDIINALEELRNLKYEELKLDPNYEAVEGTYVKTLETDEGIVYIDENGFPLNAQLDSAGLPVYDNASANKEYHHGTHYSKGFNDAAEWLNSEDIPKSSIDDKIKTEVFFATDGVPSGDSNTDKAFDALEDAVGENGGVHALGMGVGANETLLDKYDTTGGAVIVKDGDIGAGMFTPDGSSSATNTQSNIMFTLEGNDVVVGGISQEDLNTTFIQAIKDMYPGATITNELILNYVKNYPDSILEHLSNAEGADAEDHDAIIVQGGDDTVYGLGGDDLVIGDGSLDSLHDLASAEGMTGDVLSKYHEDNIQSHTGDESATLVKALVDNIHATMESGTDEEKQKLMDAVNGMEESNDGDDTLYGGEGDDVLLGLGGNDIMIGGTGDDIMFGGSGNDYFDGGAGKDIIVGGAGDDLIKLDLEDVFVDGGTDEDGTDLDILLGSSSDIEAHESQVLGMMASGNIEMGVFGNNISGKSVDEILSELGLTKNDEGKVSFDDTQWTSTSTNGNYTEYKATIAGEDMTVFIAKTSIENNGQ